MPGEEPLSRNLGRKSSYPSVLGRTGGASTVFRHLLRALLREATYLPDPAARSYYRSHILSRFRSYRTVQKDSSGRDDGEGTLWRANAALLKRHLRPVDQQQKLLANGRQELRNLARANLGHTLPLMKVLMHTYGRSGKRRFQLLDDFWAECVDNSQPHAISDTKGVEEKLQELRRPPLPKVPKLPDQISALLAGQIVSGLEARWSKLELLPKLKEKNIWHRPMPVKRQLNKIKNWKKEIRDRLLPPLPPDEYSRLVKLVSNKADQNEPHNVLRQPRRRAMGRETLSSSEVGWKGVQFLQERKEQGLVEDAISDLINTDGVHRITDRFMRRCLQRILAMTPTVELISSNQWKARFGGKEEEWLRIYNQSRQEASDAASNTGSQEAPKDGKGTTGQSWMFRLDEGGAKPGFRKMKPKRVPLGTEYKALYKAEKRLEGQFEDSAK